MRILGILLLCLFAVPVLGAEWSRYANARFGYGIDVPPGFSAAPEADNGDGASFAPADGAERLTVWGGSVTEPDFEAEVAQRIAWTEADGWAITYRAVTPRWASYSGTRAGRVLYARLVAACGGTEFAAFTLEYGIAELARFDPVVARLVRSLKPGGC